MNRLRLRPALTLLFVEVLSFGFCLRRLGFYQDDWAILEHVRVAAGRFSFLHGCRTLWHAGVVARPLSVPIYAALCAVGGLSPLPYQCALLAANAAAAIAFYLWLERLTGDSSLALLAAAIGAAYPAHPATHYWMTNILQPLAHALALAALIRHLSWIEERRPGAALQCGALFAAAFLTKESVAFLPLLGAVPALERGRGAGKDRNERLRRFALDMAPFALAFAAGVAWQWGIARREQPLTLAGSLAWAATVYRSAVETLTLETFRLARITARPFFSASEDAVVLLWALFCATAVRLLLAGRPAASKPQALRRVAWLAGANFVAAYAPYALSGGYPPQIVGGMSRTSELGSWTPALLLAAAFAWAAGRWRARASRPALAALLFAILGAFTWTNWYVALQWAGSWSLQRELLGGVARWAPLLPPKSTLVIPGVPHFVNGTEVFHEGYGDWPFGAAFRVTTGRADVATILPTGALAATPQGVAEVEGGRVLRMIPFAGLYQFDRASGKVTRVVP